MLEGVLEGFQALQMQGKVRFHGITGLGETEAVHRVVGSGAIYSMQTVYNLLNPSAGADVPAGFYAQDFERLLDRAAEHGVGAIVIRYDPAVLGTPGLRVPVDAPVIAWVARWEELP